MPESEIKRMFKDHLTDLGVTSNPAVEMIKPRSGKSSFLKITFMTGGEKREFNILNKASQNKYETRSLTPQSVQSYQREMKNK